MDQLQLEERAQILGWLSEMTIYIAGVHPAQNGTFVELNFEQFERIHYSAGTMYVMFIERVHSYRSIHLKFRMTPNQNIHRSILCLRDHK